MPFLGSDCLQKEFYDDDGKEMTKCARLIFKAHEIDSDIPICTSQCRIPKGTRSLRIALHDDCLMTLTSLEALKEGLLKKVKNALEKS